MSRAWAWPLAFAALVALLAFGLGRDPAQVSSPLLGKPLPAFAGEELARPGTAFDPARLRGSWSLLNVWASWCAACRDEHAVLLELAAALPVYGVNHRDHRADALRWLEVYGDPYRASVFDPDGEVGIELGVYKVPESFLLDPDGVVRFKHAGALTAELARREILARVRGTARR